MKVSKREVQEYIGRLEVEFGRPTVTICADCKHAAAGTKRKDWVCLARPRSRDEVDGQWLYTRCSVANDGDCTLFVLKEAIGNSDAFAPAPTDPPQTLWQRIRGKK